MLPDNRARLLGAADAVRNFEILGIGERKFRSEEILPGPGNEVGLHRTD